MVRRKVGIVVFDEVEVLDFCGPFEVFSVSRLDEGRRLEEPSPYEVVVVADGREVVIARGGLKVVTDFALADCPPLDVLVVPGGWGTRREMRNETLIAWIAETGRTVPTLASVCTGSLLLGKAGLLDGKRATTHWKALDLMSELFPAVVGGRGPARRRGGEPDHVGGDLGRHRHGLAGRRPPSWRRVAAGHGPVHGISPSRRQPQADLRNRAPTDWRIKGSGLERVGPRAVAGEPDRERMVLAGMQGHQIGEGSHPDEVERQPDRVLAARDPMRNTFIPRKSKDRIRSRSRPRRNRR